MLCVSSAAGAARDLEIQVQRQTNRLRSVAHQERQYYRLNELAAVLGLSLEEKGGLLFMAGPRGAAQLTEGRPLVRLEDQYILMSEPVWRGRLGEWYVSEDFITKVASLLLVDKITPRGEHRYRVERLDENRVRVEIVNYPDHVSIIFVSSRRPLIRVKEFLKHIAVGFEQYLVTPELSSSEPDRSIVADVQFNPRDQFGSFEIIKGDRFASFREYNLRDPWRKVIDVYPRSREVEPTGDQRIPEPVVAKPVADVIDRSAPEFRRREPANTITIDPGHGGDDYGVSPTQEVLEKRFAYQIAERVSRQLERWQYRVVSTRGRDINLSATQRSSVGNLNDSRAFVSIHLGGSHVKEVSGAVVYVHHYEQERESNDRLTVWEEGQRDYLGDSRLLAVRIQRELNDLFGTENEVVEAPLAVLAPVLAPAVLVEAGHLTHPQDLELLQDPFFQERIAAAIVRALVDFLR